MATVIEFSSRRMRAVELIARRFSEAYPVRDLPVSIAGDHALDLLCALDRRGYLKVCLQTSAVAAEPSSALLLLANRPSALTELPRLAGRLAPDGFAVVDASDPAVRQQARTLLDRAGLAAIEEWQGCLVARRGVTVRWAA